MEIPGGNALIILFVHGRTSYDVGWRGFRSKLVLDIFSLSIKNTKKFFLHKDITYYQGVTSVTSYTYTVCCVLYNQACSLNKKTGTNMYTFINRVHV